MAEKKTQYRELTTYKIAVSRSKADRQVALGEAVANLRRRLQKTESNVTKPERVEGS